MPSKAELFARLAEGHAARVTVVTPNRRLAQELVLEFDGFQIKRDLQVWEAADILPFEAFAQRLYEDALYSGQARSLPLLLTAAQEQQVWERILAKTGLLAVAQTAAQCRASWRLAHAWRIRPGPGSDDAAAFAGWAREYAKHTRGETDAARLPDLLAKHLARKPKLLVAYGFDLVPPQTSEFFGALNAQGVEVVPCAPNRNSPIPRKISFQSNREELETAARWARARLEAGATRIGVVVPALEQRRDEVIRVFSRVMRPARHLPGAQREPMPFNVSLGAPLSDYPLVHAALSLLELSFNEIDFSKASKLIRSPFLGGAESEMARRARLDAALRKDMDSRVSLPKLIAFTEACPDLRSRLENLFTCAKQQLSGRQSPHDWGRHFTALLEAAGFPGERALDSEEFQTRAKWNEALSAFAGIGRVLKTISSQDALRILKGLCTETLYQPESGDAPVQVLGVLESAGLEFEHLWVSGLTEEAWPLAARPDPFLPIALQKKAGIPEASAEASLALDRRITEGWTRAAGEVLFSFPAKEADRDLAPSPLIAAFEPGDVELPDYPRYRDVLFSGRKTEFLEDPQAPPLAEMRVRGGTRVLADQAACPFRAFARWRLGAEPLEAPAPGLDAAERGRLLHELMKSLWAELKGSSSLKEHLGPAIQRAADSAVNALGLVEPFADLEQARLAKLAREWLEVEKTRGEFEVVSLEERRALRIADLELAGRIDRMDRLADGTHALIDYKTGRPTPRQWDGERPDEPQLPLYAVCATEEIGAVAFAKLRAGDMKFMGFSRKENLVPGVKAAKAWQPLLESWKKALEGLAAGFTAGDARVDPKNLLKTCRNCGLQPLCRVYERINALAQGEDEAGE